MNTEMQETEMPTISSPDFAEPVLPPADGTTDPLLLPPAETSQANEQAKQLADRLKAVLSSAPEYVSDFFSEYKRPLITLGLIFAGVITTKLVFAMLDALDDIPLLSPTFKLIGFGYSVWFVYRYLLKASTRQELASQAGDLKNQIIGNLPK